MFGIKKKKKISKMYCDGMNFVKSQNIHITSCFTFEEICVRQGLRENWFL